MEKQLIEKLREALQKQFTEEMQMPIFNSQDEPEIEYVWWLENKLVAKQNEEKGKETTADNIRVDISRIKLWKGKSKPLPNDYYESERERFANNGRWDKEYRRDLKAWGIANPDEVKLINKVRSQNSKKSIPADHLPDDRKMITAGAEEIKMQTDCDCMVCSFAMLMGYSYDFAKTFFPERAITKTGYRWEWLIDYLKANGIYLSWWPSKNEVNWSKPAILDVPSLTAPDKGDHIIFWSGTNIIDPSRKELRYIEIPEEINCAYQINEKWTKAPKEEIKVKEAMQSNNPEPKKRQTILKKLAKLAKDIDNESRIDDDVTGGHVPEPENEWVKTIYEVMDLYDTDWHKQ